MNQWHLMVLQVQVEERRQQHRPREYSPSATISCWPNKAHDVRRETHHSPTQNQSYSTPSCTHLHSFDQTRVLLLEILVRLEAIAPRRRSDPMYPLNNYVSEQESTPLEIVSPSRDFVSVQAFVHTGRLDRMFVWRERVESVV